MNHVENVGSDILETREDAARVEISCSVIGYQECRFSVDVGWEFLIYKKIGSTRGQLGHLERTLVSPLWPFKDRMKWRVMISLRLNGLCFHRALLVSVVKRYRPNKIASAWFDFVRFCLFD